MPNETQHETKSESSATIVTWAVVVQLPLEAIPVVKRVVDRQGGRILYQRTGSTDRFFWIDERPRLQREEVGP